MSEACEGRRAPKGLAAAMTMAEDRDALAGHPAGPGDLRPFGVTRRGMLSIDQGSGTVVRCYGQ